MRETAAKYGADAIVCSHWADGSAGTEAVAHHLVALLDKDEARFAPIYSDEMPLWDKIETVAQKIYGADHIRADTKVRKKIESLQSKYGHFPVCMAKTQYSFSTDPKAIGAPDGHTVPIREVRLSAGAEFIVAICGEIMTMPGLPKTPAANSIRLNENGEIEGLF